MKKFLVLVVLTVCLSSVYLVADDLEVSGVIKSVTVYTDRALIEQETTVAVPAGTTVFKLTGLSPYIDLSTINVNGTGQFTIMAVTQQINYIRQGIESPAVKSLRDQLKALEEKIEERKAAIGVLEEKKEFLVANRAVMSGNTSFSIEQFKNMMSYYASNIEEITMDIILENRIVMDYQQQAGALKKQIDEVTVKENLPTGEIAVTVSADRSVNGQLLFSYVVLNAGWYPSYDIRVDDIDGPLTVVYKANIYQTTGMDWNDVMISLSNATPWVSGNVPGLYPWYIDFYYPRPAMRMANAKSVTPVSEAVMDEVSVAYGIENEALSSSGMVSRREGETTMNFDFGVPYTVLSDGRIQTIEIQESELNASYKYVTVPKLSSRAYLTGEIDSWGEQGFQSGEAALYFGNGYVGNSTLNASSVEDTLSLSLGVDNSIVVSREKQKDYTSTRVIGTNKTDIYSFNITVKNNKGNAIDINVMDQLPVSSSSDITVEALELSGGKVDISTGEVSWDISLKPQESRSVIFTYSVKYPKGKTVILE